ncbi:DAZAP1 [Symbiodinium sp. KB8]|nr:DAZAP1 [Symbiodinium sp. KB8]
MPAIVRNPHRVHACRRTPPLPAMAVKEVAPAQDVDAVDVTDADAGAAAAAVAAVAVAVEVAAEAAVAGGARPVVDVAVAVAAAIVVAAIVAAATVAPATVDAAVVAAEDAVAAAEAAAAVAAVVVVAAVVEAAAAAVEAAAVEAVAMGAATVAVAAEDAVVVVAPVVVAAAVAAAAAVAVVAVAVGAVAEAAAAVGAVVVGDVVDVVDVADVVDVVVAAVEVRVAMARLVEGLECSLKRRDVFCRFVQSSGRGNIAIYLFGLIFACSPVGGGNPSQSIIAEGQRAIVQPLRDRIALISVPQKHPFLDPVVSFQSRARDLLLRPMEIDEGQLRDLFANYGMAGASSRSSMGALCPGLWPDDFCRVMRCKVLPHNGMPDRAALVEMGDVAQSQWIVNNLNGNTPAGMSGPIKIGYSQSKGKGSRQSPYEQPAPGNLSGLEIKLATHTNDLGNKLWVGQIPLGTTKDLMYHEFSKYGAVQDVYIRDDGKVQGRMWGFVTFVDSTGATEVLSAFATGAFAAQAMGAAQDQFQMPPPPMPEPPQPLSVRPRADNPCKLWVGGIPAGSTEMFLREEFGKVGQVNG